MNQRVRVGLMSSAFVCILVCLWTLYSPRVSRAEPDDLQLNIWHTESDDSARAVLSRTIARFENVVNTRAGATGRHVRCNLQFVPWGQLALRLAAVMGGPDQPDVTHLEPFMTAAFVDAGRLYPLDTVLRSLESQHAILPAIRDLQTFGSATYGIAYGVGVTLPAYRRDWVEAGGLDFENKPPRTWDEMIAQLPALAEIARDHKAQGVIILPGSDPFFMDQFFGEVLASVPGSLFEEKDGTFRPAFTSDPVNKALKIMRRLAPYLVPNYDTIGYLDQFRLFARGDALLVPVTYVRATGILERECPGASANVFSVFEQPGVEPGRGSATIDCEDWVVMSRSGIDRAEQQERRSLGQEFITYFYDDANYLPFTASVPVHLTPIFADQTSTTSGKYWTMPKVEKWMKTWKKWGDQSRKMLAGSGRVNPILMSARIDNRNPYLYECQKVRTITDMVQVALDPNATDADLIEAQKVAQDSATGICRSLSQGK